LALQAAALQVLKKIMKYAASQRRHRWASGIFGGDERDRPYCRAARGWPPAQHPAEYSHQLFRRREQAMQRFRRSRRAEVRLSSCPGAQPIQSGSPSRDEGPPQLKTLLPWPSVALSRHKSPVARWRPRCMSTSLWHFDNASSPPQSGRDRVKRLRRPCERLSARAELTPNPWRPPPLLG
jgi:hypothetical protein